MTRVQLYGGGAHGRVLEFRQIPPPDLRVPIGELTWAPPDEISPRVTMREEIYYMTGIVTAEGAFLYGSRQFREQVRASMDPARFLFRFHERMRELDRNVHERMPESPSQEIPWSDTAQMSGIEEYPWDAIRRDTEKLIAKIDEIMDDAKGVAPAD